ASHWFRGSRERAPAGQAKAAAAAGLLAAAAASWSAADQCEAADLASTYFFQVQAYSLKSWPKYTSRTCGLARIWSAEPDASTVPWLTIYARPQIPKVSRTL